MIPSARKSSRDRLISIVGSRYERGTGAAGDSGLYEFKTLVAGLRIVGQTRADCRTGFVRGFPCRPVFATDNPRQRFTQAVTVGQRLREDRFFAQVIPHPDEDGPLSRLGNTQPLRIEDLAAEERGYRITIDEISEELRRTPEVVAQIQHLQKEIHYTYVHYDKLLEKMLDTMASEADDIRLSNAKIISPATIELNTVGRMQSVYVAFSILLGISLGIGFGFLLENMDHSVKSASDIEEELGVPLLGSVPESRGMPRLTRRVDRTFGRNPR